jgi:conjugative transfer signal peptidase TraF
MQKTSIKSIYSFILLVVLFSLFLFTPIYGVCINVTPSMPKGIYLRDTGSIHRSDIVALCLEEPYKTLGLKKFYIGKGHRCQGADPLIKEVIAIPGDDVVLTDQFIRVNKTIYLYPTFYADSLHRKLAVYPRGKYSHVQGYWVIGTHSPYSWDSRYFGEIHAHQILYKLKPALIL